MLYISERLSNVHSYRLCFPGNTPTSPPHTSTDSQLQQNKFTLVLSNPLVPRLLSSCFFPALFPPTQSNCRTEQALYCVHFYLRPPAPVCVYESQGSSLQYYVLMSTLQAGSQLWIIRTHQYFLHYVQRFKQVSLCQDIVEKLDSVFSSLQWKTLSQYC